MRDILERLGLLYKSQITLEIAKSDFKLLLSKNIDEYKFNFFEVFSKSKNRYKGLIQDDSFIIKRKRRIFDSRIGLIKVTGQMSNDSLHTQIALEVNGWNHYLSVFYTLVFCFYVIGFSAILTSESKFSPNSQIIISTLLLFHMALMLASPIILLRKSIRILNNRIRIDFNEMVRQKQRQ